MKLGYGKWSVPILCYQDWHISLQKVTISVEGQAAQRWKNMKVRVEV